MPGTPTKQGTLVTVKLLAFAGSLREASYNKRLAQAAARAAEAAGAAATYVDLRDYPMPLLDQDLEARDGLPEPARRLREHALACDGFLIAVPEYNGSMSGVFKNTVDWLSRAQPDKLSPFAGRPVGLMSASPGGFAGLRGQEHVRAVMFRLGCTIVPPGVGIPNAGQQFDDDGNLTDERLNKAVTGLARAVVAAARKP